LNSKYKRVIDVLYRPGSCSDVNEPTGIQSSWNELFVWLQAE